MIYCIIVLIKSIVKPINTYVVVRFLSGWKMQNLFSGAYLKVSEPLLIKVLQIKRYLHHMGRKSRKRTRAGGRANEKVQIRTRTASPTS